MEVGIANKHRMSYKSKAPPLVPSIHYRNSLVNIKIHRSLSGVLSENVISFV